MYKAPKARILVVDDYQMNLKVFVNLLKDTGMQIVKADSGKACLKLLQRERFHMVFLDHMMPEMDGIETFRRMQEEKLCEGVPVIMLTANAIVGDKEGYLKEGFDAFLSKPIIPDKLDKMILKYLPKELVMEREDCKEVITVETASEKLPELDRDMGLRICSGDEEFYLELLQDFTQLTIKEELAKYLKEGDYKNYCVRVHGFKNNAYSIGAKELGDLAYEMEKVTRETLPEDITELQERLFEQYDRKD